MRTILLLFFLFPLVSGFGQEVKINEKGERIIVFSNGSWKYYDAAKNEEAFGENVPFQESKQAEQLSEEERIIQMEEKAIRIAEKSRLQAAQLASILQDLRNDRLYLEDELQSMKNRSEDFASFEIGLFEKRVEVLEQEEKWTFEQQRNALERAELAEKVLLAKPRKRGKWMAKLDAAMQENLNAPNREKSLLLPVSFEEYLLSFKLYDPAADVILNPPDPPCSVAFEGVDRFSGALRKDLEKRVFFTHTREALRPYLDGREYLTCTGQLTASAGLIYLSIEVTIVSNQAHLTFGGIPKGSVLTLFLLNGEKINLINKLGDRGKYNALDDTYTFKGQYPISPVYERMLLESELDRVRIVWNTGYEDYEVTEMDFFRDQLNCLY